MKTSNLANDASYETGLLKNIHLKTFMMKPNSRDHELIPLNTTPNLFGVTKTDGATTVRLSSTSADQRVLLADNIFDHSFDGCYVRLHVKKDISRVICDSQINMEMSVEDSSILTQHQQPTKSMKNFEALKKSIIKSKVAYA